MNWQEDINALRMVRIRQYDMVGYVRVNDVPEHMRGWFIHWLEARNVARVEDEAGDWLAYAAEYDEWVESVERRLRLAAISAEDTERFE